MAITPDYMSRQREQPPPVALAVSSLCFGLISLLVIFYWPVALGSSALAVALGRIAQSGIRRGVAGGANQARGGVICGGITLGIYASMLLVGLVWVTITRMHH